MSDQTTAQSNDNGVNNPSTEAGENNDGMVSQDVINSRISKISAQKNEAIAKADKMSVRLAELEAKDNERVEADRMLKGEQDVIISELKLKNEALSKVEAAFNTRDAQDREEYLERLSEEDKEFGEGMETSKLRKFSQGNRVQPTPNAGKTDTSRQGVNPTADFGGHSSLEEFARQDPKGTDEYLRKTLKGYNGI